VEIYKEFIENRILLACLIEQNNKLCNSLFLKTWRKNKWFTRKLEIRSLHGINRYLKTQFGDGRTLFPAAGIDREAPGADLRVFNGWAAAIFALDKYCI
jgi:hypothetical protein